MRPYSNIISYNLIRLAAVSNYKLAQLTFTIPSRSSLQKTLFVKKMLDDLYSRTPPDWFSQMIRWEFLTAEALEDMTQKEIETIIDRYKEIICHFPGDDNTLIVPTATNMGFKGNNRTENPNDILPWAAPSPPPVKVSFSQRLATELVNLFDMEFTLDLSVPDESLLNDIDELYPKEGLKGEMIEDWSYIESNSESIYEPSVNSSFELSETEEYEDDASVVITPSTSILAPSIHTIDYTDLFDSMLKKKVKPFERMKLSLSKKKSSPKKKGLKRSPSVASSILKRLSPF